MKTALIDNKVKEYDDQGYVYGLDITGRKCRVSYHSIIAENFRDNRENLKVIASGHVYVLNYNKETHVERSPMTFEEYLNNIKK